MFNYQTPTSSVLVKRRVLDGMRFEEGLDFKAREDIDLWLRLHRKLGRSVKVNLELVGYRVIAGQISGDKIAMFKKTYFCFKNSAGVKNIFGVLTPLILTLSHFSRRFFLSNFNRGF